RTFALEEAARRNLTLVHPFDDPAVIAGQGTLALEMLEQIPALEVLIVPIGGGGLISGMAVAAKALNPEIEIIGVQAERYPAAYAAFHGGAPPSMPGGGTVAEGIAVQSPGIRTMELIRANVHDIVLVGEEQIEAAIFTLLEIEKTLAEGAGAAAFAALLHHPER